MKAKTQPKATCSGLSGSMKMSSPVRTRRLMHSNTCGRGRPHTHTRVRARLEVIEEIGRALAPLVQNSESCGTGYTEPRVVSSWSREIVDRLAGKSKILPLSPAAGFPTIDMHGLTTRFAMETYTTAVASAANTNLLTS